MYVGLSSDDTVTNYVGHIIAIGLGLEKVCFD